MAKRKRRAFTKEFKSQAVRIVWGNAVAESFFATLKVELVHHAAWATRAAARTELFEYLELFYNRQRRHSALGYLSPRAFERRLDHEASAA
jgi:putative transposase